MIEKIIRPQKKEDLIINLPEEFLSKKIHMRISEVKETLTSEKDIEAIKFWKSYNFNSKKFKFNRKEANVR